MQEGQSQCFELGGGVLQSSLTFRSIPGEQIAQSVIKVFPSSRLGQSLIEVVKSPCRKRTDFWEQS